MNTYECYACKKTIDLPVKAPRRTKKQKIEDEKVETFIRENRMVEAIKEYRSQHGIGLKEAKDAVLAMKARIESPF